MPITPKSHDFIEGYIFGKIEKKIIEAFINKDRNILCGVTVPKSWFGLRATKRSDVTLPEHEISKLRLELRDTVNSYNTNKRSYEYDINIFPEEQYIRFVFVGNHVEPVKEMTIEQIEKELGYKIKVVSE